MTVDKKLLRWQIKMGKLAVEFMMSKTYDYLVNTYEVEPEIWYMSKSDEYVEPTVQLNITIGDIHFTFDKFFDESIGDGMIMMECRNWKPLDYTFTDYYLASHFNLPAIEDFIIGEMAELSQMKIDKKNSEKDLVESK